jgi:hypothetical protein
MWGPMLNSDGSYVGAPHVDHHQKNTVTPCVLTCSSTIHGIYIMDHYLHVTFLVYLFEATHTALTVACVVKLIF